MGYTDADWVGNSLDRKSTTGFCTFVGGNLVQSKIITTYSTRSHDQLANIFTKSLPTVPFLCILSKLGSKDPLDPA
ncbi:hypothetical protein ACFX12_031030 [Malus domestica]